MIGQITPLFYNKLMITCILLSAGISERFGQPKALARIFNKTVIEHIQNELLLSTCDEIIVVLGASYHQILPSIFIHSRIKVVYNKDYNFGQTSSLQVGVQVVQKSSTGVMILPVDCPLIKYTTINTLIDHFNKNDPDILIPTYQNKKGHPPIFHQRLNDEILALPLNLGLNSLFVKHPPLTLEVKDSGIIKSFNTPEEFERMKS